MLGARVRDDGSLEVKINWEPTWIGIADIDSREGKLAVRNYVSNTMGKKRWRAEAKALGFPLDLQ